MSPLFRVIIILVCLGTSLFLHRSIKKAKSLGIYSTPNFLFLLVIFILLLRLFHTHVELGKLEEKVNRIVQDMALKERKERERETHLEIEQEDSQ